MRVRFLGAHNTETCSVRLPGVLVDGILALDAGSLGVLSAQEQLGLKAILLTHQHFDHLRDLPILGMNLFLNGAGVAVYGLPEVQSIITKHLLNGSLYSRFMESSIMNFCPIIPGVSFLVGEYSILPVAMRHSVPAVGYEIRTDSRRLFYSGDTGPGLSSVWKHLNPDVIIIEVTSSNHWTDFALKAGHFTPALLKDELAILRELKGYIPPVFTIHMNSFVEDDIQTELAEVAHALHCSITPAHEGMEIEA